MFGEGLVRDPIDAADHPFELVRLDQAGKHLAMKACSRNLARSDALATARKLENLVSG